MQMRNRIFLGTAPGEGYGYGYKRPVKIYANVEIRVIQGGSRLNIDHEPVADPHEVAVTFDIVNSAGTDLGGGAMGLDGLDAVKIRRASSGTFDALRVLIGWHLNGLTAGCAHVTPVYETDRYGRSVPSLDLTPECPETGYKYGHAWLVRELDDTAYAALASLGINQSEAV